VIARSLVVLLIVTRVASADHAKGDGPPNDPAEQIIPASPMFRGTGVELVEHNGAQLPMDAAFRTSDGTVTTLGAMLTSGDPRPTILTFNYADCPMLCSMQLTGLVNALPKIADASTGIALRPGVQFRIVTISLEPNEPLAKLDQMRARYLDKLPDNQRGTARDGWTMLAPAIVGDDSQIRRVAGVVGFKYNWVPERAEWAHPAAFVFVSPGGKINRYVEGFELPPPLMRESILKAGISEPQNAAGFTHLCYFWDPDQFDHSRAGMMALKIAAAVVVVLLAAGIGLMTLLRRTSWARQSTIRHVNAPILPVDRPSGRRS
jgi:protein SCO1/2